MNIFLSHLQLNLLCWKSEFHRDLCIYIAALKDPLHFFFEIEIITHLNVMEFGTNDEPFERQHRDRFSCRIYRN